jgi:hypothetical protein
MPIRLIQEKHVCLQLMQSGCEQRGATIPALGWSRGPANWPALCAMHGLTQGSAVDVLYRVRKNSGAYAGPHYGGLELELCALQPATQHGGSGLA